MNKERLLKLAGMITEQPPKTTKENPLVTLWDGATSKDYPEQGIIGHMHLSTAANIHSFETEGLAEKLATAGVGKRIKVSNKVYLEYSDHNTKHLKEDWTKYDGPTAHVDHRESHEDAIEQYNDVLKRHGVMLVDLDPDGGDTLIIAAKKI